jgi:hypothetical protein
MSGHYDQEDSEHSMRCKLCDAVITPVPNSPLWHDHHKIFPQYCNNGRWLHTPKLDEEEPIHDYD